MKTKTSTACLNEALILSTPAGNQVRLASPAMVLKRQGSELMSCALRCEIALDTYQQIETQALFNLQPDLKGPISGTSFSEQKLITIKMVLHPILIERLTPYANQIQSAIDYLLGLSHDPIVDPLLKSESWFATTVQQQQAKMTAGYKTFWHFVELGTLKDGLLKKDFLSGAMAFIQQKIDLDLSALDADIQSQFNLWETFRQANLGSTSEASRHRLETLFQEEATTDIESIATTRSEPTSQNAMENALFSVVHRFFIDTGWDIHHHPNTLSLELKAHGNQGEWRCLAQVEDFQEQFLFYSFCPVTVPAKRRPQLAEFCVRANFGMVLGNFELDFDTGTLRYKTSLDVEGSFLEVAMVNQLVQTNLDTMDRYWPAMMQVIYGGVSPVKAISAVE